MTSAWLSLSVGAAATAISLPFAVLVAWVLERSRVPGRGLLHTIVLLPLVLPPVVTGYLLLLLFSPRHPVGAALPVAFHWLGAVVAAAVVGFPLFVLNISLAMKAVDPRLEIMSRTLGRTNWQTFWRVTLPLSWPGILAGAVLAFARGLGEFGATIILAGRIPGETETISLAVYAALESPGGESTALALVGASVAIALIAVAASRTLESVYRRRLDEH